MIHELKLSTVYFLDVILGKKTFEVRKNDRNFKLGDLLALNEYDTKLQYYTGNSCLVYIDYILENNEYCKEGYVVMTIKPCVVLKKTNPRSEISYEYDYSVPYATMESEVQGE